MELSREKKKKSHCVSPPLLPSFISLILPVEFHGKSLVAAYSRAGWGSTAMVSQSQRQIPRDEEQDLPWPNSALFEPLALHQCKGSPRKRVQNALPKTFPAPATAAHLALPRKKKGNKIGNRG